MTSTEASNDAANEVYPIQYRIDRMRFIDGVEYLSLADAAKGTPYSQEYLSLLARRGALEARKLGRNWYVTRAAFHEYVSTRAKKNISSVLDLMHSVPKTEPEVRTVSVPSMSPVLLPTQPMPVFITLPASAPIPPPVRTSMLSVIVWVVGALLLLSAAGYGVSRVVRSEVQKFFDRTFSLVQQMQNQKPVQNITVIQQSPAQAPALQKIIVQREIPVFYPGPMPQPVVAANPQTGAPIMAGASGPSYSGYVSGSSLATLDSVVANGNSTGRIAFFNGGLYGGTGGFQSLAVNRDASFGSLEEQNNIGFTVHSKDFVLDSSGNGSFAGSVEAQSADIAGIVSAAATFGSGLTECSGSEFLQWASSSGTFSCKPGGTGSGTALEVREPGFYDSVGVATLSFDTGAFALSASGSSDTVIKLDYLNGPASRSTPNTWTALNTFSAGASISGSLEIAGTASVSGQTLLAVNSGNVGIGTTVPTTKLQVVGSASVSRDFEVAGTASSSGIFGSGLSDCANSSSSKLLWSASTGTFSCGTDQTGSGGLAVHEGSATAVHVADLMFDANMFNFSNIASAGTLKLDWTNGPASRSASNTWTALNTFSAGASVSGSLEVAGNASISGSLTFVGASTSGNFDPTVDNTYSLGDSTYRWKSINIGPGSLHITSTTGTTGTGADYTDGILQFTSGSSLSLGTQAVGAGTAGSVELRTNNLTRLFVATGGNVGIGTTNVDAKLEVAGTASISGSVTIPSASSFNAGTAALSQTGLAFGDWNAPIGWTSGTKIRLGGSNTDGNLVLTNNANNNFGLLQLGGTTSSFPAIKRSGANLLVRLADDSGYSSIVAANVSASANFEATGYASASQYFGTAFNSVGSCTGSSVLQWNNGVFSCTTTTGTAPYYGLAMHEGAATAIHATDLAFNAGAFNFSNVASAGTLSLDYINGPASRAMANTWTALNVFSAGASVSSNLEVSGIASISQLFVNGQTVGAYWSRTTANTYLTNAGDNVGIGTTNVDAKFEVSGNASISNALFVANDGRVGVGKDPTSGGATPGTLIVYNPSGTASISLDSGTNAGSAIDLWSGGGKRGTIRADGTARMYINGARAGNNSLNLNDTGVGDIAMVMGGGNVGIGTITPGAKLSIVGAASISGNFGINTNKFYVNATSGNVGIGTTNVDAKLEVAGTASISGQTLIWNSASVSQNFEVSGTASSSQLFGSGLSLCSGKLLWSAGLFSCGIDATGALGGGLAVREGTGTFAHVTSLSFDAGAFNISTTASESIVKLDWTNGPASRAMSNTWTALNVFSTGASVSTNLEVSGTASVSALKIGGTAFLPSNYYLASNPAGYVSTTNSNIAYITFGNTSSLSFERALAVDTSVFTLTDGGANGSATIGLAAGLSVPLTASTSNWDSFYHTPSTRITAGTNLAWSGNTLNVSSAPLFTSASISTTLEVSGTASVSALTVNGQTVGAYWSRIGSNTFLTNAADNVGIGDSSPEAKLEITNASGITASISNIFYVNANGRVSVGTSSPQARFEITQDTTTIPQFKINGLFGSSVQFAHGPSTSYSAYMQLQSGAGAYGQRILDVRNSGSNLVLTITESGNVGIGTTSPRNNLYVSTTTNAGGITIDGTTSPALNLRTSGTTRGYLGIATSTGAYVTGSVANDVALQLSNSNSFLVGTGSLTGGFFKVQSDGNVGIGTTNVEAKLEVNGIASVSGDAYLLGNVGIGTSTPASNLQVGAATAASSTVVRIQNANGADLNPTLEFFRTGQSVSFISYIQGADSNNKILFGNDPANFTRASLLATTKFLFDMGSGNAGIGSTTPEQKLEVAGSILASASGNVDLALNNTAASFGKFTLRSEATPAAGRLDILGGAAGATTLVSVASTGNVGIGTTNFVDAALPSQLTLFVNGGIKYTTYLRSSTSQISLFPTYDNTNLTINSATKSVLMSSGGAATTIKFGANDIGDSLGLVSNGSEMVRINTAGNVGIGTTNVDAKLEVAGTASISGSVTIPSASSFNAGTATLSQVGLSFSDWNAPIGWTSGTKIRFGGSNTDGNLVLTNNANNSFGLLQLGGTTSAFPALKRSGSGVAFRLADDSAFAPIFAANASLSGNLEVSGTASVSGNSYVFGNVGVGTAAPDVPLLVNGAFGSTLSASSAHYQSVLTVYGGDGPHTGTLAIVMPKGWSSTMLNIRITGYDYTSTTGAWQAQIGGYNFSGGSWQNTTAQASGPVPFSSVRLAYNGTNVVLLLGTTSTVWNYSRIEVTDVITSFSNTTGWGTGWSGSLITDESGLSAIVTPTTMINGYAFTAPTSVPLSTDTTVNSLIIRSTALPNVNSRFGNVDLSAGGFGYPTYIQGGNFLGANYNLLLEPNGGNVGIGTTNPAQKLDVEGGALLVGGNASYINFSGNNFFGGSSNFRSSTGINQNALISGDGGSNASTYFAALAGNVGVGTTSVDSKFEVVGTASISALALHRTTNSEATLVDFSGITQLRAAGESITESGGINITSGLGITMTAQTGSDPKIIFKTAFGGSGVERMRIDSSGRVGVGASSVDARLEVNGNAETGFNVASISGTGLAGGSIFGITVPASSSSNNPHGLMLVTDVNGVVISSWSMGGTLALAGKILSDGSVSNCTGVNVPSSGCVDYAESFPTQDVTLDAGDIVAVDPHNPSNVLRASSSASVIGIVSTNPAALITGTGLLTGSATGMPSAGTVPVALAGRVPVKISEPVHSGDHLTLSSVPGAAKVATRAGQTIGIALEDSTGPTVLAFVNTSYWAPEVSDEPAILASSSKVTVVSTGLPDVSQLMDSIVAWFKDTLDIVFQKGLIQTVKGVFQTVESKNGMTTYDEATGLPYCIKVLSGRLISVPGTCDAPQGTPLPDATTPTPTPSAQPTEATSSVSATFSPAPAATASASSALIAPIASASTPASGSY